MKKRFIIRLNVALTVLALFLGVSIYEKNEENSLINVKMIKENLSANMNILKLADLYTGLLTKFVDVSPVSDQYYEVEVVSAEKHQNGAYIKTNEEVVMSMEEGLVIFIGRHENIAKCVIVKAYDGREIIYGDLENIEVSLYQYVKKNTIIGSNKKVNDFYRYYLSVKENEYLDVISLLE